MWIYGAIAIGLFLVIGFGLRLVENRMIYFPHRLEPGALDDLVAALHPEGARFREVSIGTADGETITGWLGVPDEPRAWVLWLHGNAGNVMHRWEDLARFVTRERLAVLIVDYRGYGRSTGSPDEEGLYEDARAALAWLEANGAGEGNVVLLGRSIGAAVALTLALERPVKGLVIESAFTSIKDMAKRALPFFPAGWFAKSRFANDEKIGKVTVPILHYHGRRDEVVPFAQGERLAAAANPDLHEFVAVDSDHNDLSLSVGEAYFRRVGAFAERVSRASR